jgi:superfamily I DNA/RNA helicase
VIHAVAGLLQRYCKPNQADLLEKLKKSFAENMQGTLGQRLAAIDLGSGSDKEAKKGVVQMLTLHSSKGLEFDNVWIMGCEEGNLPHTDSTEEGERRLMYVGMTRARSRLIMSSALAEGMESRFLEEAGL